MDCLSISMSGNNVAFRSIAIKNGCSYKIFIAWCGALKYTSKKCGDGDNGEYYTHSANIDAYNTYELTIAGPYQYAACRGSIGPSEEGFEDYPDGAFTCIPTGRYVNTDI